MTPRAPYPSYVYYESLPSPSLSRADAQRELAAHDAATQESQSAQRRKEAKAAHEARFDQAVAGLMRAKEDAAARGATTVGKPVGESVVMGAMRAGMMDTMLGGSVLPSPIDAALSPLKEKPGDELRTEGAGTEEAGEDRRCEEFEVGKGDHEFETSGGGGDVAMVEV